MQHAYAKGWRQSEKEEKGRAVIKKEIEDNNTGLICFIDLPINAKLMSADYFGFTSLLLNPYFHLVMIYAR